MKIIVVWAALVTAVLHAQVIDQLTLQTGEVFHGSYRANVEGRIVFETNGQSRSSYFSADDVKSVTFGDAPSDAWSAVERQAQRANAMAHSGQHFNARDALERALGWLQWPDALGDRRTIPVIIALAHEYRVTLGPWPTYVNGAGDRAIRNTDRGLNYENAATAWLQRAQAICAKVCVSAKDTFPGMLELEIARLGHPHHAEKALQFLMAAAGEDSVETAAAHLLLARELFRTPPSAQHLDIAVARLTKPDAPAEWRTMALQTQALFLVREKKASKAETVIEAAFVAAGDIEDVPTRRNWIYEIGALLRKENPLAPSMGIPYGAAGLMQIEELLSSAATHYLLQEKRQAAAVIYEGIAAGSQ
jgi:hypothetical protein